jgi:hypothetical protein
MTTTSSPLGESLSYTHCSLLPGSLPLRVRGYAIHPAAASCCSAKVLCVLAVGGSDGSVPLLASSWKSWPGLAPAPFAAAPFALTDGFRRNSLDGWYFEGEAVSDEDETEGLSLSLSLSDFRNESGGIARVPALDAGLGIESASASRAHVDAGCERRPETVQNAVNKADRDRDRGKE